jgi:hypothetical protein
VGNAKDRPGGLDGLENRSGKCEGPPGGGGGSTSYRTEVGYGKDRRKGGGVDGVENPSGKWEGPAGGGALRGI